MHVTTSTKARTGAADDIDSGGGRRSSRQSSPLNACAQTNLGNSPTSQARQDRPYTSATMMRPAQRLTIRVIAARRGFATSKPAFAKNRIYPTTVRNEDELHTLIMMSSSTRIPLITLWMTNWCGSCKTISPLMRQLLQDERIGEAEGSVSYVEVEMDSPDMGGVGGVAMKYGINSIPTLLSFDTNEPQLETKVHRLDDLKNKAFLEKWIKTEAARHGERGAGGRFMSWFGR